MSIKGMGYPSREEACARWKQLAEAMGSLAGELNETPRVPDTPGHLIIIGSGIQSIGFTLDAIHVIESADYVFYCVADPVTQVFIRDLRPDAYDLYVFYDDMKVRYHTYMQMTEAMLYYVRQGKTVAGIYYGHPGVFVLSTHRAVAIARREGHRTEMRAGVSALDCLCADLGVDPAYPGMQTFEASDMLLRKRVLDISSHVVLWQVGVIGEMSYRRKGFINDRFPVLIDYLEGYYGPDHVITHYIASRIPTVAPVIERYRIDGLRDPAVRQRVTGISTFYIPPKESRPMDSDMAEALGIEGIPPGARGPVLRVIDRYRERELEAVRALSTFCVPDEYQYQEATPAARFLIELTRNPEMQKELIADPQRLVAEPRFGLSPRDQALLASRDPGRMQVAAKAQKVRSSAPERFVIDLLTDEALWTGFVDVMLDALDRGGSAEAVEQWLKSHGRDLPLGRYPRAADGVASSSLAAWTGVYGDGETTLAIAGHPDETRSTVYFNGRRLRHFLFMNDALTWTAQDSFSAGALRFTMPAASENHGFRRGTAGGFRATDATSGQSLTLRELTPDELPPAADWALAILPAAVWRPARVRAEGCFRAVAVASNALTSGSTELLEVARKALEVVAAEHRRAAGEEKRDEQS